MNREIRDWAKRLDDYVPGWARKIDLNTLDLDSIHDCLIRQIWPDRTWTESMTILKEEVYDPWRTDIFADNQNLDDWRESLIDQGGDTDSNETQASKSKEIKARR